MPGLPHGKIAPLRHGWGVVLTEWLLVAGVTARVWAYPSSLNIMPTVDLVGAETWVLQVESDGRHNPLASERTVSLLSLIHI